MNGHDYLHEPAEEAPRQEAVVAMGLGATPGNHGQHGMDADEMLQNLGAGDLLHGQIQVGCGQADDRCLLDWDVVGWVKSITITLWTIKNKNIDMI